jgi:hypothetical protein
MRISGRVILQSTLLLALTAGWLVPDAVAGSTSSLLVQFGGSVTGSKSGNYPANVQMGDTIETNATDFQYNPTQATGSTTTGIWSFTGTGQGFIVQVDTPNTVTQGGTTYSAPSWSDSYKTGGSFVITMSKSGSITTLDLSVATKGGTADAKTGASFDLKLTSTSYNAGLALPNSTNLADFLANTGNLSWDPGNDDWNSNDIGNYNEFGGTSVPEPSSLVLAVIAMATFAGFWISRRKTAAALERGLIAPASHP